jgi:hypothetical protein
MFSKSLIIFVLISLLTGSSLSAQNQPEETAPEPEKTAPEWGTMIGVIVDDHTGQAVPAAKVEILNTKRETVTITCSGGVFRVGVLDPGMYTLSVSHDDYRTYETVINIKNDTSRVSVWMKPSGSARLP